MIEGARQATEACDRGRARVLDRNLDEELLAIGADVILTGSQEIGGSNPPIPTKFPRLVDFSLTY